MILVELHEEPAPGFPEVAFSVFDTVTVLTVCMMLVGGDCLSWSYNPCDRLAYGHVRSRLDLDARQNTISRRSTSSTALWFRFREEAGLLRLYRLSSTMRRACDYHAISRAGILR